MENIKGAIFDIDGTLLDSIPMWGEVPFMYLESRGLVPKKDLLEKLSTMGGHQIPSYFREEYMIEETEKEIEAAVIELLYDFYLNTAPLKEGVSELLENYKRRGIKICAATASERRLVEPAMRRHGISSYFERIFTCREENTSKSEPEIYLRAARFLGTEVSETIVFEDALHGIKTAKSAGFIVAAVFDEGSINKQDEIKSIADYYYKSPKHALT